VIQAGFTQRVWNAAKRIPRGRATTYGEVARFLGGTRACRAVGNALNKNRSPAVPCHRVVKSGGGIGGFARGSKAKKKLLQSEGVRFKGDKVADFKKVFYHFR